MPHLSHPVHDPCSPAQDGSCPRDLTHVYLSAPRNRYAMAHARITSTKLLRFAGTAISQQAARYGCCAAAIPGPDISSRIEAARLSNTARCAGVMTRAFVEVRSADCERKSACATAALPHRLESLFFRCSFVPQTRHTYITSTTATAQAHWSQNQRAFRGPGLRVSRAFSVVDSGTPRESPNVMFGDCLHQRALSG